MNVAAAGKLALCICTGAVVGAGVNEARHDPKPKAKPAISKAVKSPAGRKVVQFPCEPYIVQDQMMRDAQIPVDFKASSLPEYAGLIGDPGGVNKVKPKSPPVRQIPAPGALGLLGLGVVGLIAARRSLLAR